MEFEMKVFFRSPIKFKKRGRIPILRNSVQKYSWKYRSLWSPNYNMYVLFFAFIFFIFPRRWCTEKNRSKSNHLITMVQLGRQKQKAEIHCERCLTGYYYFFIFVGTSIASLYSYQNCLHVFISSEAL